MSDNGGASGTLRVAVVQLSSQSDVALNLSRAHALVVRAAKAGAELVTLPENFAFMGEEDDKRSIAEPIAIGDGGSHGPIVGALASWAKDLGVFIIGGGMPEKSDDAARPFNTSVLVDPNGNVTGTYRKIHLFDVDLPDGTSLMESRATLAGNAPVISDVRGVSLGMTVCYDLRFPELYRKLEAAGARIVTVPAAFTLTTGKDHWHALLRARAIENQVFVLAPAQHGKHPRGRQTYGKSLVCDPWGEVIAQCGEGEGVALAELDFAYQDRVRSAVPCLTHKRL